MFEKMKQKKLDKQKAEAQRVKNAQIAMYKRTLPGLYNNLSKQQLKEAKECVLSIIETGQTYGNPLAWRLAEIVNKFWLEPISGKDVLLPHDLSYFDYDLEYINSLLQ